MQQPSGHTMQDAQQTKYKNINITWITLTSSTKPTVIKEI